MPLRKSVNDKEKALFELVKDQVLRQMNSISTNVIFMSVEDHGPNALEYVIQVNGVFYKLILNLNDSKDGVETWSLQKNNKKKSSCSIQ